MTAIFTSAFFSNILQKRIKDALILSPSYFFVGGGIGEVNQVGHQTSDSIKSQNKVTRQILFGKKILSSNVYEMVARHTWLSNVIYTAYDHRTDNLNNLKFFVLCSNRAVYKCISNNNNSISTIEPSSLSTSIFQTADGYQWKYLYRLSINDLANLTTTTLMPLIVDANTTSTATPGSINSYVINAGGVGYVAINSGVVRQVVSSIKLQLATDNIPFDGALNGSAILITSGPGAGQLAVIESYSSNSSGRYVTFDTPMVGVDLSSQYLVAPYVSIIGDGIGARGVCSVSNGVITGIQVVNAGTEYTWATAIISANVAYGSGAQAVPIISPPGGHGKDLSTELFSRDLLVRTTLNDTEAGILPNIPITFNTYGIVTNLKQASNTQTLYTSNVFNNITALDAVQIGGQIAKGDTVISDDVVNNSKISVIHANNSLVYGINETKNRIELFDTFKSNRGISGSVTGLTQSNVYCNDGKLLCYEDINTITHSGTTETINIILRY